MRGIFSRAGDVALGLGMHAALGGAGRAAVGGAKGLRDALRVASENFTAAQLVAIVTITGRSIAPMSHYADEQESRCSQAQSCSP
jgi:hypothetical protein